MLQPHRALPAAGASTAGQEQEQGEGSAARKGFGEVGAELILQRERLPQMSSLLQGHQGPALPAQAAAREQLQVTAGKPEPGMLTPAALAAPSNTDPSAAQPWRLGSGRSVFAPFTSPVPQGLGGLRDRRQMEMVPQRGREQGVDTEGSL